MRVWELAENLQITPAELLALIEPFDSYVTSHLCTVPEMALRAIQANPPEPTRKHGEYYWHANPVPLSRPVAAQPGSARPVSIPFVNGGPRRRRRPGPEPVSFKPPYDEDDRRCNDPTIELTYEPTWSTRDVAHYFGVKPSTVRQWVARGHLTPDGKHGPSHVFHKNDIFAATAAINARKNTAGKPSRRAGESNRPGGLSTRDLHRLAKVSPGTLLTITDAAAILGLAPATIRAWIRRGHVSPHHTSTPRRVLITLEDLYQATRR